MKEVVFPHLDRSTFGKLPAADPPLEFVGGEVLRPGAGRVIFSGLSLEEFLRLPEAKPALEFLGGEAIQKMSPKLTHSLLQSDLGHHLDQFSRPRHLGRAYPELRCTFGGRSLVPDLAFFNKGRLPVDSRGLKQDDVYLPPDLVVEILSKGETIKALSAKLDFCTSHEVRLAWLIQPTRRRVFVFRPERPVEILEGPAILSDEDVLPGFTLPLEELFGWLDADD